jgi:RHS repeat-associated protein
LRERPSQVSYNVTGTSVPATSTVGFTYGETSCLGLLSSCYNAGRLTTMSDGVGSEKYAYDLLGRTVRTRKVISSTTYDIDYAYNLGNELTSITYPSGHIVAQNYDSLGRLCSVGASGSGCSSGTRYADSFAFNTAQQVTAFNYGNGVAASFGYSADRLQMTSLSYAKNGTTLFGLNYYYKTDSTNCSTGASGNNGQIQCIPDTVDSGRTVRYTYDVLARLSTAQTNGSTPYPQWGLSETYDRYGNRTLQDVTAGTGPLNSVSVSSTTNRLTGSPYTYDSNGNMTNDGSNTLVYDAENHVVSINSAANAYVYDGNGLRVKKCAPNCTSPTTRTVYIFSGSKVIAEYDNGAAVGSPAREYLYAGGSLLARIDGSTTKYYHQDHLSNRLTTDSSGTALEQKGHFPFGEDWYQGSDKLKFTTYERDSESGNDFAMARYNVNRLGRFASPDPLAGSIANPQSLNRYAYVQNTPANLVDPSGLDPRILERLAFEAPIGGIAQGGFDQFDAYKASGCTAMGDCDVGFGWEGLSYNTETGAWGFDSTAFGIFHRWSVEVTGVGTWYTLTRDAAGEIATYWNLTYAPEQRQREEAQARTKVDAYMDKVGLRKYIAESTSYGKGYKLQLIPEGLNWLELSGVFQQHGYLWASMHAGELGVTDKSLLLDFRTGIHPSLHVPVNSFLNALTNTYSALAHLDAWNPNGGGIPFILHWICDVGHAC